ncbi:MAG: GNAT family N-acetyltransferase [Micrococcus sp.]|nr:GNAT family N-acetyltransferase [Micrococcus sp.]
MPQHTELDAPALSQHGLKLVELERVQRPAPGQDPQLSAVPAALQFLRAVEKGFYETVPEGAAAAQVLGFQADDAQRHLGIYAAEADPDEREPEATFQDWLATLTVSPGREVPAWLISNVTVSPSIRRRGALRVMMQNSLDAAVAAGAPVAALTASEATIYPRFGFGAATWGRKVEVQVKGGAEFRHDAGSGRVTRQDPRQLGDLVEKIQREVQLNTPGSPRRPHGYRAHWEDRVQSENDGKGEGWFAAVHTNAHGERDGVALYKMLGWETTPATVRVRSLFAQTREAERALWHFLAHLDLIEVIRDDDHPMDRRLESALVDRRRVKTVRVYEDLYVRILDVAACFEAREYARSVAGEITLEVSDPQGYVAGTYRLRVGQGRAEVAAFDSNEAAGVGPAPDLQLSVEALSALWLGGESVATLVAAGTVTERRAGASRELDAMLAPSREPHLLTGF